MSKLYRAGFSRRRGAGGRKGGPNSGFRLPIVVSQELIDFFTQANLGTVGGQRVQQFLPFLQQGSGLYGVASRAVLTPLFSLYAKVNNLSDLAAYNRDPARVADPDYKNRQLLGADALMLRVFAAAFANIQRKTAAKLAGMGVADGQAKPPNSGKRQRHFYRDTVKDAQGHVHRGQIHPIWNDFYHVFSPQNFTYGNFQNIISELVYKTKDLPATDPRRALLVKVEPKELAEAYQRNINSGMDYIDAAVGAAGVGGAEQVAGRSQPLAVRMNLDTAYGVVSRALEEQRRAEEAANPGKKPKARRVKA